MSVPSFIANIDPAAEVHRNGRRAELTALVNCPEGAHFRVEMHLAQDGAEGDGHVEGKCDGGLARVPVKVSARGRALRRGRGRGEPRWKSSPPSAR